MKEKSHPQVSSPLRVRRALVSVSDKRGVVPFARSLVALGIELISTGGTFEALRKEGVPVSAVSDVTGFPEILDGRVKTLHPHIHAGILGIPDNPEHARQLQELHIQKIELVVVNLYPFEQATAQVDLPLDDAIEQIDIGGPTMVRAAAKNFRATAIVVDPDDYEQVLDELTDHDASLSEATRFTLARKAFRHTAHYDAVISRYLGDSPDAQALPDVFTLSERKAIPLRYGENPHQAAALYGSFGSFFEKLHGKDLSFNNILDIQAAAGLSGEFDAPSAVIVKHNNPCGAASATTLLEAYRDALATDPKSAFGGIVSLNRRVDIAMAKALETLFLEVVIAPEFDEDALEFLKKKKDRRIIRQRKPARAAEVLEFRTVFGGLLVQERDTRGISADLVKVVSKRPPTSAELASLIFAWRVAKHVKSNAIVYARDTRTLGIGAGQMSRVDSARIAAMKAADAGLDLSGCAVASDAFFPFADGLLAAVSVGATAAIEPGGSIRDAEVIQAADAHDVAMVFTGIRHFRH
jgi:phosphoribosylaminoimidazolecarboxamide formyltransferase/IMP cyclohydrolase